MLLLFSGGASGLRSTVALIEGVPGGLFPTAPTIVSIGQASGIVIVGALANPIPGGYPVQFLNLYRASASTGPWNYVASRQVSTKALENFLLDAVPVVGQTQWYCVTAVDQGGNESAQSAALFYNTIKAPALPTSGIAAGAFGPYPLLGSDIFISPITGEAVVNPANGDLLTVSGLELLAQDLRIRLLTRKGELLLHPEFGFSPSIGTGQARPQVQAQVLAADVQDAIEADPRVSQVLGVWVSQYDRTSWLVSYAAMAIGAEDPLRANLVYPYYLQQAA